MISLIFSNYLPLNFLYLTMNGLFLVIVIFWILNLRVGSKYQLYNMTKLSNREFSVCSHQLTSKLTI